MNTDRKAWLVAAAVVLLLLAVGALVWEAFTNEWFVPEPALRDTPAETLAASETLDEIRIRAVWRPEDRLLNVRQEMTLKNMTGETLDRVVLRTWAGAYASAWTSPSASEELFDASYGTDFSTGGFLTDHVTLNGREIPADGLMTDLARTVMEIPVECWEAGKTVSLALEYRILVPECAGRFGSEDGITALGNVFAVRAVYDANGWDRSAELAVGDPFRSACANWHVELAVPSGWQAAATAWAEPVAGDDGSVFCWDAPAVRDFAVVLSERFAVKQKMAGSVLVSAFGLDDREAESMLDPVRKALELYSDRWGAYPYASLTVCRVDFPWRGMEYPGLIMIGGGELTEGGMTLEETLSHETAHQWWWAAVGSDPWHEPWQDESLALYAQLQYIGRYYGTDAMNAAAYQLVETAMRTRSDSEATPGSALDAFEDSDTYSMLTYQRAAALWLDLEKLLGRDGLDSALRTYRDRYLFRIATREDLTGILSEAAGFNLSALISDYLDQ